MTLLRYRGAPEETAGAWRRWSEPVNDERTVATVRKVLLDRPS